MALIALVIGRQTAGRVMPARWAMREADFEVLLHLVERLGGGQPGAPGRALAAAPGGPPGGWRRRRATRRRCGCWRRCSPPPRAARTVPRRGCSAGVTPAGCAATAARPAARPSTP